MIRIRNRIRSRSRSRSKSRSRHKNLRPSERKVDLSSSGRMLEVLSVLWADLRLEMDVVELKGM